MTTENDEDTGTATGWTIADSVHLWSPGNVWALESTGSSLKIAIKDTLAEAPAKITSIAVTSTPALAWNTYGAAEAIKITTTFDTAVEVTGSPELAIVVGNQIKSATYESGSGSAELVFSCTVQASDRDHGYRPGIKIHAGPTGGTIRNKETPTDANLSTRHLDGDNLHFPDHRVNGGDPGTGSTLVSNLGYANESDGPSSAGSAQSFRTGPSAATVRAVRIRGALGTQNSVSIQSDNSGAPGSKVETLQRPSSFSTAGAATYEYHAAGQGRRLEANTTYGIVSGTTGGPSGGVKITTDTDEESPRQWSIGDRYWRLSGTTWSESSFPGVLRIAIDGFAHAAPPVPPRVTGAPVISRAGPNCVWSPGETVDVTLAFDQAMTVVTTKGTPSIVLELGSEAPRKAEYHRVSRGVIDMAAAFRKQGALVFFEPSAQASHALFQEALAVSHVVKVSRERWAGRRELSPCETNWLLIETLGPEGLRFLSRLPSYRSREWQHVTGFPLGNYRDTAGAGDWCTAGILACLGTRGAKGLEQVGESRLRDALRHGQLLASWNCSYEGARGGMYVTQRQQLEELALGITPYPSTLRLEPDLRERVAWMRYGETIRAVLNIRVNSAARCRLSIPERQVSAC